MAKKPNGRFLFTWNSKKDPEITAFFEQTDEGMYAHKIREAIKFYMRYKDVVTNSVEPSSKEVQGYSDNGHPENESASDNIEEDDDYEDFDPNSL